MKPVQHTTAQERAFGEVVSLIQSSRSRTLAAVNTALVDLYWQVGEAISRRIESDGWGRSTVAALAAYVQQRQPGVQGFSAQNLWRMRPFYEAYRDEPILSSLMRELPWTSNLHILTRSKRPEERQFYLRMAVQQRWSTREVARQIDGALFERAVLNLPIMSAAMGELHPAAEKVFRDAYVVEFLDLHKILLLNVRHFLGELGRDFCFIGSEVPIQVGGCDFALDLPFFHRGLCCLVAFELKIEEFQPEHLSKLDFYLEALDRAVRKPHERPSIGVLLCASKNSEVVEYALGRSLSLALVAEYQTQRPDKKLLQSELHKFYALRGLLPSESDQARDGTTT